ncbi:hypothetical protein AWENTII_002745 [Aspergillus wentii]
MNDMEAEGAESDDREQPLGTRRACDQCRIRKIRCDKRSPCSNCRSSQTICRSTGAGQKPRETRRRVLISSQYEQKIDLIEERLAGIEEAIRGLKPAATPSTAPTTVETSYHKPITPSASGYASSTTALDHHESAFEGSSSLAAHSAYASQFLETAVSRGALQTSSPKINEALYTLKQIVNMQDNQAHSSSREVRFPNKTSIPGSKLQNLTLPPTEVVVSLLRTLKESDPSILQGFCPFITTDRFIEKCRDVYFATEDYSDATFIVVNGVIYYVLMEYGFTSNDQKAKDENTSYLNLCRNNLETALSNLNFLMPARTEYIEALTLGAVYAIEISKPTFAWTLTSTAARLCQTLGYHRASSTERDKLVSRLFWSVYTLDKVLSLRLGRSSTLQDYDISLAQDFDAEGIREPWRNMYNLWIKLAGIQGRIYEHLYSPAALSQPESQRVSYASQLASEMQLTVQEPFRQLCYKYATDSSMEALYIKSDEVSRLSVLTLIYRAIPPPADSPSTFITDCVETAREALECHQVCLTILKESNEVVKCSYMHWSILYAPFVPFIVLFCHIIETSSQTDLIRLTDFVASLQPISSLSEAIAKLYHLCHVLTTVARLYVEAKDQDQNDQTLLSVGQEFDTYLTALGLAPVAGDGEAVVSATTMAGDGMEGGGGGNQYAQTTQLGNWFSGNQYMMGLLEGDLSFDPSVWS